MIPVTETEFGVFLSDWYQRLYPHQRLGQSFINTYFESGDGPDSELFYEEDSLKAIDYIYRKYIKD